MPTVCALKTSRTVFRGKTYLNFQPSQESQVSKFLNGTRLNHSGLAIDVRLAQVTVWPYKTVFNFIVMGDGGMLSHFRRKKEVRSDKSVMKWTDV